MSTKEIKMIMSISQCYRCLVTEAERWIGMTEQGGNNKGQFVELVQKDVSREAVDEPWCADFVYFCCKAVTDQFGVLNMRVENGVPRTASVMRMWNTAKDMGHHITLDEILSEEFSIDLKGMLAVWKRGSNGIYGHIGIVSDQFCRMNTGKTPVWFKTIEGNSLVDGKQGVWEHTHRYDNDDKLLGFIDPFKINPDK